MNRLTVEVFKWCWLILVFVISMRADGAVSYIEHASLMTEPSLCRRAGVPVHPDGCLITDARLGWQFPSGEMRVSLIDTAHQTSTVTVTSIEQRSLRYEYEPVNFHVVGGSVASYAIFFGGLVLGLLPMLGDMKRVYRSIPWT